MKINGFIVMNRAIFIYLFLLKIDVHAQQTNDFITNFENGVTTNSQIRNNEIIKHHITDRMKFRKVPAVRISVIKNGQIVFSKNYGLADVAKNIKTDSTTLFHFASISKTANALCVMKLVEEGKLSLTEDFRKYIKDGSFKENKFSKGQKITLANLLSHTAGIIKDDGPSGDYTHNKPLPTITQIVKGEKPALGSGAISIEKPNQNYQYSNQAVCIIQKILADNFDTDYNRLLENTVFKPLKMNSSTFALKLDSVQAKRLAQGYVYDYEQVPAWVFPCQAEGGLVSTADDVAKMVIAIQNGLNEKGNTFLKKETIQQMVTPQLGEKTYLGNLDAPYKNGLGVMLFEKGGRQYFTHTGSIDGYTSVYVGSFDGKDGAVIILNTSNAGIIPELLNSIATTFNWENYVDIKLREAIEPKQESLNQYIGTYKLTTSKKEFTFTISQNNNQFFIQTTNDGAAERLFFSAEKTAFVLSRGYTVEFSDKKGVILVKDNREFSGEAIKIN
jgi:CubicO group peptidase (beta-lactamase class C family)